MTTVADILNYIESIAPPYMAESWDNVGLLCGRKGKEVKKILDEDGTYELPTTVTLLVNSEQAKMLVEYEHTGVIHADLVYRGDSKGAKKFLDAQDHYFELLEAGKNNTTILQSPKVVMADV